jgi:hypothetical protein
MASIVDTGKINEDGYVLLVTVLLLLILTIIGIAAIHTATVEIQLSGNNRRIVEKFYVSEGSLITVLENSHWWLGEDFIKSGEVYANWSRELDFDEDGTNDVLVEVRCVEPTQSNIATLTRAANNIPSGRHIAPPPINSGYSARYFKIRKYAVTATDLTSGTHLQSGVWKVFGEF